MTTWALGVWAEGAWATESWLGLEPESSGPTAEPGESVTSGRLQDRGNRAGTLAVRFFSGVLTDDGLTFGTLNAKPLCGSIVLQDPQTGALTNADLLTGRLAVTALTGVLTTPTLTGFLFLPGPAAGLISLASPNTGKVERWPKFS
jgi:hypothetical protein